MGILLGRDSLRHEVAKLKAGFPAFTFRLIRGHDGDCIEAVRTAGSGEPGLYVLISDDPAEVARELPPAA